MHLAFALGLQAINNRCNLEEKSVFEGKRMLKHLFSKLVKLLKTIFYSASLNTQPSVVMDSCVGFS